jgi:hypothetical protein
MASRMDALGLTMASQPGDYTATMAAGGSDGDHPGEPKAATIPRPVTTPRPVTMAE